MCPVNIQEFEPYYTTCLISIGLIIIQIIIFRMQETIGPRFFIPDIFLPPKYDYFRSIDILKKKDDPNESKTETEDSKQEDTLDDEEEDPGLDCPICLTKICEKPEINFDESIRDKAYVKLLKKRKREFMKAPCGHSFHIPCLVNWMSLKMECPSCRADLPGM